MIKIKLEQLMSSIDALKSLSEKQLKARTAYMVAKVLKLVDAEIQEFNEARMNLIKKYGDTDEAGELILDENQNAKIDPTKIAQFQNELSELLTTEVEINANKVNIADVENIEFTPSEMTQLEVFIDMGEDE